MLTPYLLSIPNTPDLHRLAHLARKFGENAETVAALSRGQAASLWGRLLVRHLASRALGVPPGELRWTVAENGKPYLHGHEAFHFNLSHTRGAVAAAVSGEAVGVDVEYLRPAPPGIAARYFAPGERAYIAAGEADRRFFEVWTRKEAYLKRDGTGIRVRLSSFDVTAPPQSAQLTTGEAGAWILSCCGTAPAAPTVCLTPDTMLEP